MSINLSDLHLFQVFFFTYNLLLLEYIKEIQGKNKNTGSNPGFHLKPDQN
jgi:hypothetical protein